jgi:hypothetical protein
MLEPGLYSFNSGTCQTPPTGLTECVQVFLRIPRIQSLFGCFGLSIRDHLEVSSHFQRKRYRCAAQPSISSCYDAINMLNKERNFSLYMSLAEAVCSFQRTWSPNKSSDPAGLHLYLSFRPSQRHPTSTQAIHIIVMKVSLLLRNLVVVLTARGVTIELPGRHKPSFE